MNNWVIKGHWLPQEKALGQDCLKSLIENSDSLVVQPVAGVDIQSFCDQIVRQLWDLGHLDNAFCISWEEVKKTSPADVVGQVLGLPADSRLNGPKDISKITYIKDKPTIIILFDVRPLLDQDWSDLLARWAKYLYGFKAENEQGRGLRCLLVLDAGVAGLGRHCIVPEPFTFRSWPELDETTVENFLLEHFIEFCEPVSNEIKQYAIYKLMGLGGNRKLDLLELMRMTGEMPLRSNPSLIDSLNWQYENVLVKQAMAFFQEIDSNILIPNLKCFFRTGGFISQNDERSASSRKVLDLLWEQGLYTPPWADKTFGTLTPRALTALDYLSKEVEQFSDLRGLVPIPWADRAAREIMDRCLQIERMIKKRAVQLINNSTQFKDRLKNIMDSTSRINDQKTNREVIIDSLRWQSDSESVNDVTLLESCTLSNFFMLFDSLGLQQYGNRHEHKRFVEIRNTLAHAHRSNWDLYKGFLNIEESLIGERE
jgi:hypothetical protein